MDHGLRARCLGQLHEGLIDRADDLRGTLVTEVGKPVLLTYVSQLDSPASGSAWLADLVERYAWETDLGNLTLFGTPSPLYVRRELFGVAGATAPWNFLMQNNLAKEIPALGAGTNGVLVRKDRRETLTLPSVPADAWVPPITSARRPVSEDSEHRSARVIRNLLKYGARNHLSRVQGCPIDQISPPFAQSGSHFGRLAD
jgi:Aldehyde dehydrogenase family